MIGQDFFDLRSRIGTALFSLAKLAPEAGADPDHSVMLESLVSTLKDPFVFVVVGEVNVGKSTLLNALFAADITKTGVIPTTDKILFFKHGPVLKHVSVNRTLEEVFVPVDFLRDFHIVDTPGTNSIENEHQEITERFVPMADLVIFVFSSMNPWGASAWQFLEKVHRHWMRHVIFVLQQSDLRTDEEIAAILDYMRQLCRQRFEREFPIFPVSAKKAYLSRSSGVDRERLMAESGFQSLEQHISRVIGGSGQRLTKLATALRTAGGVLSGIAASSVTKITAREEKTRVLRDIEFELMQAEDRTNAKLVSSIEATEADFEREGAAILARVREQFTVGAAARSVLRERRTVVGLERYLLDQVHAAGNERWSRAAAIIEDDVCAAANRLKERMMEDLKVQMRDELRSDPALWEAQRFRFVARVEELLQGSVHRLGLERALEPELAQTRNAAAGLMLVAVVALTGGAFLAVQQYWLFAGAAVAAGVVSGIMLWATGVRGLARAKQATAERLAAARPELRQNLAGQLRAEVRNLYESFTRFLQPTRDKLAEQEARHMALQGQLHSMERMFHGLDSELGSVVTVASH